MFIQARDNGDVVGMQFIGGGVDRERPITSEIDWVYRVAQIKIPPPPDKMQFLDNRVYIGWMLRLQGWWCYWTFRTREAYRTLILDGVMTLIVTSRSSRCCLHSLCSGCISSIGSCWQVWLINNDIDIPALTGIKDVSQVQSSTYVEFCKYFFFAHAQLSSIFLVTRTTYRTSIY